MEVLNPKRVKVDDEQSNLVVNSVTFVDMEPIETVNNPVKLRFLTPAAEPCDYDCIPHLLSSETETIEIKFHDQQLLPENTRNRQSTYVLSKRDFYIFSELEEIPTNLNFASNNPLFSGKTKPLLLGNFIGNIVLNILVLYILLIFLLFRMQEIRTMLIMDYTIHLRKN